MNQLYGLINHGDIGRLQDIIQSFNYSLGTLTDDDIQDKVDALYEKYVGHDYDISYCIMMLEKLSHDLQAIAEKKDEEMDEEE